MRPRILISFNSYKECADSVIIAESIRNNLSLLKNVELITRPISDGGDGFLNVCRFYFDGVIIKYLISTAYDESKFECQVLYCNSENEVYIESAEILGLKVVPKSYRNPMKLSSKGLGELLLKIEEDVQNGKIKVKKVFIGVGGTATIDMGMGMISKLGLKLLDAAVNELNVIPENYLLAKEITYEPIRLSFELIPIVDVNISLLGTNSGIRIFGKQKGADGSQISLLEKSFSHLLNLFENNQLKISSIVFYGAGGGIPAAFQIFFKSRLLHSSEFIRHNLRIDEYLGNIDYLITGEGAYDYQSNYGKGADTLIELFKSKVKTIFLVCGMFSKRNGSRLSRDIYPIALSNYFTNKYQSIVNYEEGLKRACS